MRTSEKPVKLYIIRKNLTRAIQRMQVLSNSSNFVKRYGHLSEILAFLPQALTKIWLNQTTSGANYENW